MKKNTMMKNAIEQAWALKQESARLTAFEKDVDACLALLNTGEIRVAEKKEGAWITHQWIKKAILLSFYFSKNTVIGDSESYHWFDKIPLKKPDHSYRCVPGSIVRHGSFVEPGAILMPSFVNIGAYVGSGTMVDTWVTIGSCAQIGKNCHISDGVGIGGVLEPVQSNPVIIEDHCFIGARSQIAEGMIIEEGAVVGMGCYLGASTKIVHRATGKITYGRVPAYSVVVPGMLPDPHNSLAPGIACAVIVKEVDAQTRSKTSLTDLLRDI